MRIQQYIVSILFLMILTGCTKDFNLDPETAKPLLVIEGRISNMRGPYYVRITKSTGLVPNPDPYFQWRDSAEAVENALVIITDDTGVKDTLIPGPSNLNRYVYYFRDSVTYAESSIDSVFTTVEDRATTLDRGYYQTTKLKGQPGHTYNLEVQIGDSIFRASAYMPSAVPVLEQVEWKDTLVTPYPSSQLLPIVSFKDLPDENNYYGINWTGSIHAYRYDYFLAPGIYSYATFNVYPYYVFDDKSLTTDLNRVAVRYQPMDPENHFLDLPMKFYSRAPLEMRLYAFTRGTYDYFNAAYKQLEYNGNIYKPAPASAHSNISGGALGLFYATTISDKLSYH